MLPLSLVRFLCGCCAKVLLQGMPPPHVQVREGDWITADGTTLGSDNGGWVGG